MSQGRCVIHDITSCTLSPARIALCALGLMVSASAAARCDCKFKEKPWEAYGTKAACVTYMYKGNTSCEVEFGGTGADRDVVKRVLNQDPEKYQQAAYATLIQYLGLLSKKDYTALTSPDFLLRALPGFLRGVYLRSRVNQENMFAFDKALTAFLHKNRDKVTAVFRGTAQPFTEKVDDVQITILKGILTAAFRDTHIVAVYLPAE